MSKYIYLECKIRYFQMIINPTNFVKISVDTLFKNEFKSNLILQN